MMKNDKRAMLVKKGRGGAKGPVIYWMGREQRANDNWPLIFAQRLAIERRVPLVVVFCVAPKFLGATLRQYHFMLTGLKEAGASLKKKNIPFVLLAGEPRKEVPRFVERAGASALVTDFEPLKIKIRWKADVASAVDADIYEVDGRNIVPCREASPKQEFGAYTIRSKIHRLLDEYAVEYPRLKKHPYRFKGAAKAADTDRALAMLKADRTVKPVTWLRPGEKAALNVLKKFLSEGLERYPLEKNDASKDALSNLSPYLHFGQISSLTVYHAVKASSAPLSAKKAFIEELVIRRELSDNFCHYNKNYDSFEGLPDWAKRTLDAHRGDHREYLYSLKDLEAAKTHDPIWNAAQKEMIVRGKMHGYLRMYWGKKILEWTRSPEEAIKFAIYLNDRYELDGRDTNGYAGILWSIGGLHDRAWSERDIFGKIRYMSYDSQIKKHNLKEYIKNAELP